MTPHSTSAARTSPRKNMCATGLHNSNVPGVVTVLEPTRFPPLSSVLGEIQFVGKILSRPECRIGIPLVAAALTPGPLKHGRKVDINPLHVFLAHAHASVMKATAKQHGIRLTGEELVSCSAWSREKEYRAPTPHHATRRATQPLGLDHIDTAGLYPTSLGGHGTSSCSSAALRVYRGRHSFCRERLRGRYGAPTRIPH